MQHRADRIGEYSDDTFRNAIRGGMVVLSLMPASSQIRRISPCDNSRALSVSTSHIFFPDSISPTALKTLKASAASDFS